MKFQDLKVRAHMAHAKMAWLTNVPCDIVCIIAELAQVTNSMYSANPEFYDTILQETLQYARSLPEGHASLP